MTIGVGKYDADLPGGAVMNKLDVSAACDQMFFVQGGAMSACLMPPEDEAARIRYRAMGDALLRLAPFLKALAAVARAHEAETLAAWKRALQEPMPFGGAPLGLPEDEEGKT